MKDLFGKPDLPAVAAAPDPADPGSRKKFADAMRAGAEGGQKAATFSKGALASMVTKLPGRPSNTAGQ
ncbi:MAG: hypothetical protein AAGF20_00390 [Pseudomonadota bacterium]